MAYNPYDAGPQELPQGRSHSYLGITSCVLAVFAGIVVAVSVGMAGYLESQGALDQEDENPAIMVGCAIFAGAGAAVLGAVLGGASFFESNKNPVCGILGLVFNSLILLGLGALFVIGLTMA